MTSATRFHPRSPTLPASRVPANNSPGQGAYQRAGYKTGTVGFEGFEGGERGALSTFVVVSDLIQLVIVHSQVFGRTKPNSLIKSTIGLITSLSAPSKRGKRPPWGGCFRVNPAYLRGASAVITIWSRATAIAGSAVVTLASCRIRIVRGNRELPRDCGIRR
jgi:hypothetical protein